MKRQRPFSQRLVYTDTKNFETLAPVAPPPAQGTRGACPSTCSQWEVPRREGTPFTPAPGPVAGAEGRGALDWFRLGCVLSGYQWAVVWPWGTSTLLVPQFAHLQTGTILTPRGAAVGWNELLCVNGCQAFSMRLAGVSCHYPPAHKPHAAWSPSHPHPQGPLPAAAP